MGDFIENARKNIHQLLVFFLIIKLNFWNDNFSLEFFLFYC